MLSSEEDDIGNKEVNIMIIRRILKYGVIFLCIFMVLSCICLYEHRQVLSIYFSSFLSSAVGIGLYLLIFGGGILLMIKALFK